MGVEAIVTAPGFREVIFNFLWYCVELIYMLSVIAYVGYTLDFPHGYWNRRRDTVEATVPAAAVGDSWKNAGSFLQDAALVARSLKQAVSGEVPVPNASESQAAAVITTSAAVVKAK